jgi:RND family efflux transporter MFP subunit
MKNAILRILAVAVVFAPAMGLAQSNRIKGFTEPYHSIDVAAAETGTLAQISVSEGDQIASGDVLANLNEDVLTASLAMANEGSEAKGKLNSALAELKMQTEKFEKLQGLFNRQHASQTELDRAKTQLEVARAQVETVKDDLRIKTHEVRRIQAQLEQRRLRSPIDGIVTRVFKETGEFVSANDPVVATVVQLNPLLVVFSVPLETAGRIEDGQTVDLQIAGVSETTSGVVEFVSPTADAQSGTCRVKVRIANPELDLVSGLACYLVDTKTASTIANSARSKSYAAPTPPFRQTSSSR